MAVYAEYGQTAQIFSVSGITELIRGELEHKFPFVWVRGEVTDYSLSSSGHMYFSLKDANSQLQCVWFAGKRRHAADQKFDPMTGEIFEQARPDMDQLMRNGIELICAGSINVYAKSGRYQLIVEHAELSGHGSLALALEQLKAKYAAAGYFAMERKRALPSNPLRIALITSPNGAAIHDFLTLASRRGLSSRIRLFPVTVQGKGAAEKMAQAIEEANRQGWADLIVLIRGGGSTEDLMEFNEPVLVEAIFNSRLPVLAGIGHEVDTFLSDMTADVRAATPSHAAQLLWPLRSDLVQKLDDLEIRLGKRFKNRLDHLEERLAQRQKALGWLSPVSCLARLEASLRDQESALYSEVKNLLSWKDIRLAQATSKLREAAALVHCVRLDLEKLAWLEKSSLKSMENLVRKECGRLDNKDALLAEAIARVIKKDEARLENLELKLQSRDPLSPLQKGYVLLTDARGAVHSVNACRPGQELFARLQDGTLELTVKAVHKNGELSHV